MKMLGFVNDDVHNRNEWKRLTSGNRLTLPQCGNEGVIPYGLRFATLNVNDDDDDDDDETIGVLKKHHFVVIYI